ncbi:MAG: chorismate-binding protein, partial [Candidatus Aenigmatarchaeota archaeon]
MIIYPFCEKDLQELLSPYLNSYFVFLETAIFDKNNFYSFLFKEPNYILDFNFRDDPQKFFKKIEYFLNKGFWLAGYFTYEFGYFLEPALANLRENYSFPLVWLGVFKEPIIIDHRLYKPSFKDKKELKFSLEDIRANIYKEEYGLAIKKIKNYLEEGLTYQVNFTFKLKFKFKGNILDFYFNLRRNQPTSYMALINTKNNYILSLSPELFFKKERDHIQSSAMK